MKNVVKCWKDFLSYFTTLETYREMLLFYLFTNLLLNEPSHIQAEDLPILPQVCVLSSLY
jgi:hypothetical protein